MKVRRTDEIQPGRCRGGFRLLPYREEKPRKISHEPAEMLATVLGLSLP